VLASRLKIDASLYDGSMPWGTVIFNHFPTIAFILIAILTTYFAIARQWSLIPVLGLLTNFYLMSQLGLTNWMRFLIWLVVGLVIYFVYGMKHSKLLQLKSPGD
jgi:uncharacterized membrane protein